MKKIISLLARLKLVLLIALISMLGYPVGYFVLDSSKLENHHSIYTNDASSAIGIYLINLNRSKERYEYIKDYVGGLGFELERVEAVDGSTLSMEEIDKKVDLDSYKIILGHLPKRGTIGCSLSHIKAWETFLNSNLEFVVIFEDDVSFDPQKVKVVIEDLVSNREFWDIATLEIHHKGLPLTIKNLKNNQHLDVYLAEVTHSGAYIINRKAAKKLLEKAFPIKMPIDHYFTRSWELDLKFTGIENPRLVYQTFGESEISKTKNLADNKLNWVDSLKHRAYKLQSYVIRFFYNLKLYLVSRY